VKEIEMNLKIGEEEMNMPQKGFRDIKGLRDVRGAGSLNIRSGLSTESKRNPQNFQLNIEKDSLLKVLEQFDYQKAKIEKRLSEIAQMLPIEEASQLEELLGRKNQEESRAPEKDDDQHQPAEKKVGFDFRLGKLSFGDLIQGIGSFMDQVSSLQEEGKGEERFEGEISSPSGRVKAVYGLSIKEGLGGRPIVEPFGNVKKTAQGPVVEEVREPLVDIFDEEDHVSVIVELPGVQLNDIHTEIKGDILTLSAANSGRKYYKEVVLPEKVNPNTASSKYKNGIFEIRMQKN
jgi:HSP20 family protein